MSNRKNSNDRMDELIYVDFSSGNYQEKNVSVWLPTEVFIQALREYFDDGLVTLDGTDTAIFNRFGELELIDKILDNDDFIDVCKEVYKESKYYEEDLEEWVDDYEFDHNLGRYKEEEKD